MRSVAKLRADAQQSAQRAETREVTELRAFLSETRLERQTLRVAWLGM